MPRQKEHPEGQLEVLEYTLPGKMTREEISSWEEGEGSEEL
jgi:hypothetical protein